ncbi:MAG: RagB/SusD family nutrient uptake outer membrane protein [Capnocytophaga felis]|nr:RagB/SusD family nutrient uptake outer membrane protein [Capnocytophaga felis]
MKKIKIGLLAVSSLAILSCKKDFLESEPSEWVANPKAEYKLNGLYPMMINIGTGGTSGHDDFGQKGYDIFSDILSSDVVLASSSYGWFRAAANYESTKDYINTHNYIVWRYYYRLINAANDVIAGLGGNDAAPANESDRHSFGQAKAIRGYAYFYLLQFYTKEFKPASDAVPLYLEPNSPAKGLAKQSEVYKLIEDDLNQAVSLLEGFTRVNKSIIDKNVAKGLLAYVYGAQHKYADVAKLAKDLIENSGFPITTKEQVVRAKHNGTDFSGGGFNDVTTPSWMWGFDITTANDFNLRSWWGQMDIFTYGYAWAGDRKTMDENLYKSMRDDDVRKGQFGKYGSDNYVPYNKFFTPERKIGGQRTVVTDYVFMRVDEFHLLAAEALAKTGEEEEAKTILKNYLKNRLDDVTYIDALSGVALSEEIYKNTRLEFWGEGKSYLAMKRNKASVTRGANHLFHSGKTFVYNSDELTFDIPQSEIQNNPHITKEELNE